MPHPTRKRPARCAIVAAENALPHLPARSLGRGGLQDLRRSLMRAPGWLVVAGMSLSACSTPAPPSPPSVPASTAVLYEGARLITGDAGATIENASLVVDHGRIVGVGRAGEVDVPAGASRVDLTGKTVMPALVGAHVHVGFLEGSDFGPQHYTATRSSVSCGATPTTAWAPSSAWAPMSVRSRSRSRGRNRLVPRGCSRPGAAWPRQTAAPGFRR